MEGSKTLTSLPVELLYDLYLLALSSSFPLASKYIYTAIKTSSPLLHARYLIGRHSPSICRSDEGLICISGKFLTRALRYPICTIPVLDAISRLTAAHIPDSSSGIPDATGRDRFELPKRIFRSLDRPTTERYGPTSDPLPLMQFLWRRGSSSPGASEEPSMSFMKPLANSHSGYALFRAVYAQFTDLVQFLLDRGADPGLQNFAAVKAAILAKDLSMVKMLVECDPEQKPGSSKKRKRSDRIAIDNRLLDLAIRNDGREIADYFMREKGVVPDMKTLKYI